MSYILEALKKSQQTRELGQVPRLQQAPMLEQPPASAPVQRWVQAALGLAMVAVVLAGYAALRPAANLDPPSSAADRATEPATEQAAERAAKTGASELGKETRGLTSAEDMAPAATAATAGGDPAAAPLPETPDDRGDGGDISQVLVVPAAPKPGERLPRGAEELRRAVLGTAPASAQGGSEERPDRAAMVPDDTPLPPDLIAEIERFKRSLQQPGTRGTDGEAASAQAEGKREPSAESTPTGAGRPSAAIAAGAGRGGGRMTASRTDASRPPALSATLRQRLPPFSVTVHVYDPDPQRRFVYLNGRKLREGELSRDGFMVEQVRADGAIFRYDEHRFFLAP